MRTQGVFSIRFAALLALMCYASDAWAVWVEPASPSYTGSYTVRWSTTLGYSEEDIYPCYPQHWVYLYENGVLVASSGYSMPVSGKAPGFYDYYVYYVTYTCGFLYDEGFAEEPVTVQVIGPPAAPGTPDGPNGTEYTGSYTISWNAVSGAATYRLEEQFNGQGFAEIYNAAGTSVLRSGRTQGSWQYQVRACNAGGYCGGYSGTKTVTVSAPATPTGLTGPSYSYGGGFTIDWNDASGADRYTLQQRVNGGGWSTIHDALPSIKVVPTSAEGNHEYQVRACSGAGCSNFSSTITLSVVQPPSTTGATAGSIPGSFSVGTQGDANYTIPIAVPAGTGGLKPSLALSYDHQAGNGLAGMHWTLAGISAITRCPQTVAQDSVATALSYSVADRYCLNGQRLVNINGGAYHADLTEYRTEIESFQRIKQQGTLGGGATSFYVDHGNGLRSYFGETSNARVTGVGGAIRMWYISRTVDQFGNTVSYSYNTSTADGPIPGTISWTSNSTTSPALPARYSVAITYENRPTDDQRSGSDGGGAAWSRTQRIDKIDVVYNGTTTISTYDLTYDVTPPPNGTGRSRLTQVSVCRGSECLPATAFAVQAAISGYSNLVPTSKPIAGTPLAGDWNGDGKPDLFVSNGTTWSIYPSLIGTTVTTSVSAATSPGAARVVDFNGDGLADLLYKDGSTNWKVAPSTGTTSSPFGSSIDSGVPAAASPTVQDHDGDGLADLIFAGGTGISWLRNQGGSFGGGGTLFTAEGSVQTFSTAAVDSAIRSLDFNGDGRADLIAEVVETVCNPNDPYDCYNENKYYLLLADGYAYNPIHFATLPENYHHTNFRFGDFNGDGLGEFMYLNQYMGTYWLLQMSHGTGITGVITSVPTTNADKVLIADYDGDGRDDLLRPDGDYWRIHRSSGTTLPASYTASVYSPGATTAAAFMADVYGTGRPNLVRTNGAYWGMHVSNNVLADVVTAVTDGLGRTTSVEYQSLASTPAYTLDLTYAPSGSNVRRFGGARYVVTTETHDNGIGGTRAIAHAYDTAVVNTAGRGWQSFRKHTITDTVEGTYSVTQYSQTFPTAGMVELAELNTIGADGIVGTGDDRLVRSVDPVDTASAIAGTTPQRQFVRVEQTTTVEKEVGGAQDGLTLRTIAEDPIYDSTYGFVTSTTRTVTQPGVTGSWVTTTNFDPEVIDGTGQWCLGLPGTVAVSNSIPGGSPVSRTVDNVYTTKCRPDTVTDLSEASDTTKQLRRKFEDYDGFGNARTVKEYSVAGGIGTARTTTLVFDSVNPQFPDSVTVVDPVGGNLTTLVDFDPLLGLQTSVTGPDGLTAITGYDAFGRLTLDDPPGGSTTVSYRKCATGGCLVPNAAFYVQAADSTGATSYTFFDVLGRPVGSDSPLAGSRRSRQQTVYLPNGQVQKGSLPYVAGEGVHWVTRTYDALGRTKTEDDEDAGTSATYDYLGTELKVTDGKSHATRYIHNALGQINQVVDAGNGNTYYTYYPFGELATVTDNSSNVTTIAYDARGYKLWMFDPDMGLSYANDRWEYVHNAYGELVQQTDAKNQVTTLQYDAAGRLDARIETEGTTDYIYYGATVGTGLAGRLQEVRAPGDASTAPNHLRESYVYSSTHGQLTQRTRTIGSATYTFDFLFDTHGRLSRITYPTNVDAQRLAVEYLYDGWGALSQVRNQATPSLVYYTLNSQEGSGAVRRATLGNGLVEKYTYEAATGQLSTIQTGPSETATLQNLAFDWDLAGNLEQRVDQLLSRTEVFNYDALDRLTGVVRNSSTVFSVSYNNLIGNITTKTGVTGTYAYGSSRPHAVTAIGSMSFGYDLNGNMTNRNGTTLTWSSYNLPIHIQRPSGEYSDFLYGGDRDRYRQIEGAGALQSIRHYASAGLFETLTWNSGASRVDYHYIHANGHAVAQFTASNVETDTLEYLHRDHQGSVVATTSSTGTLLDRFEYDPFGVRTTTTGSDARVHRGYTGHEHLKAQELIHMNGRVQDPLLGRFLSPDPIVQAPYDSRSLNRYSYVWNNPLSLVDPSGFAGLPELPVFTPRTTSPQPPDECSTNSYFCGDPCLFGANGWCDDLDLNDQLWVQETLANQTRDTGAGGAGGGGTGAGGAGGVGTAGGVPNGIVPVATPKGPGSDEASLDGSLLGAVSPEALRQYWRNFWALNNEQHQRAVDYFIVADQALGYTLLGREVTAVANGQLRRYDYVVRTPSGYNIGVEVKTTRRETLQLNPNQVVFDVEVVLARGAITTVEGIPLHGVVYQGALFGPGNYWEARWASAELQSLLDLSGMPYRYERFPGDSGR